MERVVVIDTDAGVDDAAAIFLVLSAHARSKAKLRVVGITCVNGNTNLENVCRNVTRILHTACSENIPVFKGCETAMVLPYSRGLSHHGSDGFGDANLSEIGTRIQEEHAALALIRLANQFPGQLCILALGPLTNIAMASKLDRKFRFNVKEVCLMGGNTEDPTFNFKADPEAAFVILSTFPCQITVVPYETCKLENLKEFRLKELTKLNSPAMELLNKIEAQNLEKDSWSPCDLLAAAVFIDPEVVEESKELHITTDLAGCRGQMIIDRLKQRNATIVYSVNIEHYKRILFEGLGGFQEELF